MSEPVKTKGKEIAEASFIAYLDYLMRDELHKIIPAWAMWKDKPVEQLVAHVVNNISQRVLDDYQKQGPVVMQDIGKRLAEVTKKL